MQQSFMFQVVDAAYQLCILLAANFWLLMRRGLPPYMRATSQVGQRKATVPNDGLAIITHKTRPDGHL